MPACKPIGSSSARQGRCEHPRSQAASAFRDWSSQLCLWFFAAACLAADLLSKSLALQHLRWDEPLVLIPHLLRLQPSLNAGALFGMGPGFGPVFVAASVLALPFVLYIFAHSHPRQRLLHAALSLILAGAMGNLYDRTFVTADVVRAGNGTVLFTGFVQPSRPDVIRVKPYAHGGQTVRFPGPPECTVRRQGVVRDFIKIEARIAGRELWPWVFNLADAFLVLGVCLLMLNSFAEHRARRRARRPEPPAPAGQA
jgi:lipoprotein signal peptidase